eukprot:1971580-Prymnesium_polylepis.1
MYSSRLAACSTSHYVQLAHPSAAARQPGPPRTLDTVKRTRFITQPAHLGRTSRSTRGIHLPAPLLALAPLALRSLD